MSAAHDEHGHGDDAHGHGHSPFIQHHYDDAQHQFDSGKLGIWLFLAQEVLFFSALFVAYILYRHHHPEIYGYAHKYLDVKYGAINTAVLIFSSLTAAWAVRAAQLRQRMLLITCLAATIACACGFLVIKYIEYTHKVHEHLLFGKYFDPCIAADESPLLTKNNQCPGSKGSVLWDYDKGVPELGCFPTIAIDTNSRREGVQADCQVREAEFEIAKDGKGEPLIDPDTKAHVFIEKTSTPIKDACKPAAHGEEGHHGGPACWRTSYQPAVCHPGWFFTQRCTAGTGVAEVKKAVDAAKATKDEAKIAEAEAALRHASTCGSTETFTWSKSFPDKDECGGGRGKREKALKAIYNAEIELKCPGPDSPDKDACKVKHAKDPDVTQVEISDCVRSEQVGFVVEHHDHEVRPKSVAVAATCKAPPKPNPDVDPFADKEQKLGFGTSAIGPSEQKSPHEEHEALYSGPPPENTNMFFTIYFAMTGLHGIHVLVGVFVFIWLLIRAIKGHFTPEYFGPVDWAALYWHIVDLIWIFLFPLMYLIH
jgi:heme/copper-type cytochrome/quinol oxidase subunit 3